MHKTGCDVRLNSVTGPADGDVESFFADADFAAERETACEAFVEIGEGVEGVERGGGGEGERKCWRSREVSVE